MNKAREFIASLLGEDTDYVGRGTTLLTAKEMLAKVLEGVGVSRLDPTTLIADRDVAHACEIVVKLSEPK